MIDAEKREKAIKGLEICTNPGSCSERCPYYHIEITEGSCDYFLLTDALALLREQEARVLTLDEVLNAEDFVWAEIWTPGDRRWCLIYARINKSIYDDILMFHEDSGFGWTRLVSNYNMKGGWRCWSARPTEEQRMNTPWEEMP